MFTEIEIAQMEKLFAATNPSDIRFTRLYKRKYDTIVSIYAMVLYRQFQRNPNKVPKEFLAMYEKSGKSESTYVMWFVSNFVSHQLQHIQKEVKSLLRKQNLTFSDYDIKMMVYTQIIYSFDKHYSNPVFSHTTLVDLHSSTCDNFVELVVQGLKEEYDFKYGSEEARNMSIKKELTKAVIPSLKQEFRLFCTKRNITADTSTNLLIQVPIEKELLSHGTYSSSQKVIIENLKAELINMGKEQMIIDCGVKGNKELIQECKKTNTYRNSSSKLYQLTEAIADIQKDLPNYEDSYMNRITYNYSVYLVYFLEGKISAQEMLTNSLRSGYLENALNRGLAIEKIYEDTKNQYSKNYVQILNIMEKKNIEIIDSNNISRKGTSIAEKQVSNNDKHNNPKQVKKMENTIPKNEIRTKHYAYHKENSNLLQSAVFLEMNKVLLNMKEQFPIHKNDFVMQNFTSLPIKLFEVDIQLSYGILIIGDVQNNYTIVELYNVAKGKQFNLTSEIYKNPIMLGKLKSLFTTVYNMYFTLWKYQKMEFNSKRPQRIISTYKAYQEKNIQPKYPVENVRYNVAQDGLIIQAVVKADNQMLAKSLANQTTDFGKNSEFIITILLGDTVYLTLKNYNSKNLYSVSECIYNRNYYDSYDVNNYWLRNPYINAIFEYCYGSIYDLRKGSVY